MNRNDLQKLAKIRVKDAKVLLDNGRFEGAYYLLGYSVECALKACIAKQINRHEFPDKELAQKVYTHKLSELLKQRDCSLHLTRKSESILFLREIGP
jgi:hypothetical protein